MNRAETIDYVRNVGGAVARLRRGVGLIGAQIVPLGDKARPVSRQMARGRGIEPTPITWDGYLDRAASQPHRAAVEGRVAGIRAGSRQDQGARTRYRQSS